MNLLMLTKFYPYGTGEAFIENEIEVLAEYYDNITIIACEAREEDKGIRALPKNVKAYKVPEDSKFKDIINGIAKLFSDNKNIIEEKKECNGLISRVFLGYFEAKSQRIYKFIQKENFIDNLVKESYVIYSYWFFMTARVATLIAEDYKPIYMFTRAHRYDLYEEENKIKYLPYRKLFLGAFDNIFPCSDNGTNHLKKKYPTCSENVVTSLLGTLDYGSGEGSTDGIFRIISCSRLEPVKRVNKLIEGLQVLDNEELQIEWTHIGSGDEFGNIKKYAEENLHNIRFNFMGNMKNVDIMKLYKEKPFDLFVNVSSSEGLPVSIMEAISFGIPIIATDVGGTSEIVINGVTGKLITNEFNKEELAAIVRNFATNGDLNVSRDSCRMFWKVNFQAILNYNQMCRFVEEQYRKKLGK